MWNDWRLVVAVVVALLAALPTVVEEAGPWAGVGYLVTASLLTAYFDWNEQQRMETCS